MGKSHDPGYCTCGRCRHDRAESYRLSDEGRNWGRKPTEGDIAEYIQEQKRLERGENNEVWEKSRTPPWNFARNGTWWKFLKLDFHNPWYSVVVVVVVAAFTAFAVWALLMETTSRR
ncbi:MAG: hypothetical protein ACXW5U_25950 [Thermoanaerobaculia bacterium]